MPPINRPDGLIPKIVKLTFISLVALSIYCLTIGNTVAVGDISGQVWLSKLISTAKHFDRNTDIGNDTNLPKIPEPPEEKPQKPKPRPEISPSPTPVVPEISPSPAPRQATPYPATIESIYNPPAPSPTLVLAPDGVGSKGKEVDNGNLSATTTLQSGLQAILLPKNGSGTQVLKILAISIPFIIGFLVLAADRYMGKTR